MNNLATPLLTIQSKISLFLKYLKQNRCHFTADLVTVFLLYPRCRAALSRSKLITQINKEREHANLSSAVRLYVLDHYRRLSELGPTVKGKR
jgi:hypothetical protein